MYKNVLDINMHFIYASTIPKIKSQNSSSTELIHKTYFITASVIKCCPSISELLYGDGSWPSTQCNTPVWECWLL